VTDNLQFAIAHLAQNPWVIAYAAGVVCGWQWARRSTRYMLGGRL
jgi:hypothetical protein